ncbi:MAG: response regulator [Hyphomicrobiaceae bacterium]|nr:response regulator [Hyphomicrobiaceae bacterium]
MIAEAVASELPYLRRFARALCGRQESGDSYVAMTLEALVADPSLFDTSLPPRVALYKVFLKIWQAAPVNQLVEHNNNVVGTELDIERRLELITPRPRQAFLLVSVEGFKMSEAASILDVPEQEVVGLIDAAGKEIAEQIATDILIIEDEPLIALDLEQLVTDIGHNVNEIARTHREAVAAVKQKRPGLVLADIQLADGSSGLSAVNEILQDVDVPVIFITAYPERLLTGDRPEPTFLITKPFQPEMVKAMISQALFFNQTAGKSRRSAA